MNIYEEAKVITHDEIKDRLKKAYSNNRYLNNITIFRFHDYINQQELKEQRAKKVEESLNKIIDELKQIEKLQDRNAKISKIIYGDYGLPKYQNIEHEQKQNEYTILYYPFIKIIKQLEEEIK